VTFVRKRGRANQNAVHVTLAKCRLRLRRAQARRSQPAPPPGAQQPAEEEAEAAEAQPAEERPAPPLGPQEELDAIYKSIFDSCKFLDAIADGAHNNHKNPHKGQVAVEHRRLLVRLKIETHHVSIDRLHVFDLGLCKVRPRRATQSHGAHSVRPAVLPQGVQRPHQGPRAGGLALLCYVEWRPSALHAQNPRSGALGAAQRRQFSRYVALSLCLRPRRALRTPRLATIGDGAPPFLAGPCGRQCTHLTIQRAQGTRTARSCSSCPPFCSS
jgi:hypothetical protein